MVSARSNGKVNLKLKKFRFNYFSRKMNCKTRFFTQQIHWTLLQLTSLKYTGLKLKSIRSGNLFFMANFLLIHLRSYNRILKLSAIHADKKADGKNASISQEMGRIYNSIHDALEFLGAKRF